MADYRDGSARARSILEITGFNLVDDELWALLLWLTAIEQLPEELQQEYRERIEQKRLLAYDKDGDGRVSSEELPAADTDGDGWA